MSVLLLHNGELVICNTLCHMFSYACMSIFVNGEITKTEGGFIESAIRITSMDVLSKQYKYYNYNNICEGKE